METLQRFIFKTDMITFFFSFFFFLQFRLLLIAEQCQLKVGKVSKHYKFIVYII